MLNTDQTDSAFFLFQMSILLSLSFSTAALPTHSKGCAYTNFYACFALRF